MTIFLNLEVICLHLVPSFFDNIVWAISSLIILVATRSKLSISTSPRIRIRNYRINIGSVFLCCRCQLLIIWTLYSWCLVNIKPIKSCSMLCNKFQLIMYFVINDTAVWVTVLILYNRWLMNATTTLTIMRIKEEVSFVLLTILDRTSINVTCF